MCPKQLSLVVTSCMSSALPSGRFPFLITMYEKPSMWKPLCFKVFFYTVKENTNLYYGKD